MNNISNAYKSIMTDKHYDKFSNSISITIVGM